MFTFLVICVCRRLCVCFLNGRTQLCYCARLVCVYGCNKVPNLQLCSAVGGLQRDQDRQGEEETGRLHSGCGTAQGSAPLSRGLSTPLINLSEDAASRVKSFILAFLEKVQKKKNASSLPSWLRCEDERGCVAYHWLQTQLHPEHPDDSNRCVYAALGALDFVVRQEEANKVSPKPAL